MENKTAKKRGGQVGHKGGTGRPPKPPQEKQTKRVVFHITEAQYEYAERQTPGGGVNEYARSVFLQNM